MSKRVSESRLGSSKLYRLTSAEICGFWGSKKVETSFFEDCSIFIGPNGSGKTTFIEILRACLTVDLVQLARLDFASCKIKLSSPRGAVRTITVERSDQEGRLLDFQYKISNRSFQVKAISPSDRDRLPYSYFRKFSRVADQVRAEISSLVAISSISVNRANLEADLSRREERSLQEWGSAVDLALNQRIERLLSYRLELFERQNQIQRNLREEVLVSLIKPDAGNANELDFAFVEDQSERKKLSEKLERSFQRLGVTSDELGGLISEYLDSISERVERAHSLFNENMSDLRSEDFKAVLTDLIGERHQIIQSVTSMTLLSDDQISELYKPLREFEAIVNRFFSDKKIQLTAAGFQVRILDEKRSIELEFLSSGEKQLLILLTEVFLQRRKKHVFITDEPELSLHIEWQGELIGAIKTLNPEAQLIVATHSPEIAASARDGIVKMKSIVK